MDTGAASSRRFGRIGTTPAVGRIAGGRTTEIAPTEAVAAIGSATQSDKDSLAHPDDERARRPEERYELAAETRGMLLQAVDSGSGEILWQIPGELLPGLYRDVRRAASRPGPASFAPDTARTLAQTGAPDTGFASRVGTRAYAQDDDDPPSSGGVSRTV